MQDQERIRTAVALAAEETKSAGLQPAVLMNRYINHDEVGEYTSRIVNDTHAPELKKLIDDGWLVFRIQTELRLDYHVTVGYLAKMRAH